MKIVLIGAGGDVGRSIVNEFARDSIHDVIHVGLTKGDYRVDISSDESVETLFKKVGNIDAIIVAAGNVVLSSIENMTPAYFHKGLQDKLLAQIRVALIGQHFLNDTGSITLTSGIAVDDPIKQGTNAAASNAGIEGFVRAAACDFSRGIRINAISPTVLTESLERFGPFFPGIESASGSRVALAYRRSVEGVDSGRIYRVGH